MHGGCKLNRHFGYLELSSRHQQAASHYTVQHSTAQTRVLTLATPALASSHLLCRLAHFPLTLWSDHTWQGSICLLAFLDGDAGGVGVQNGFAELQRA